MDKIPAFEEIQQIEAEERAWIAAGNRPRVFYHPGRSANGAFSGQKFVAMSIPPGFALDVAGWEAGGRRGPAELRRLEPVIESAREILPPETALVTDTVEERAVEAPAPKKKG